MKLKLLATTLCVTFAGSVSAVDFVLSKVTCPASTVYELCWREKIGSDPTFKPSGSRCHKGNVDFKSISRDGQTVTCKYGEGAFSKAYSYKIGRKILKEIEKGSNYYKLELKK